MSQMRLYSRESTQNRVTQTDRKMGNQTGGQKVHPDKHDPGNVLIYKNQGTEKIYLQT